MANSTVTITYKRHGTTPPMFVAGSFTQPAWQALELDHQQVNEEYVFSKTFNMIPGTHQYKFRVGHGDWWVYDDTKDRETDEAGNVNNVITVQSSATSNLVQQEERSDHGRGAESSIKPTSGHGKSPSLGLDGVDNSDEELVRSLRREVALAENTMAEFPAANGDIEPDDSGMQTAGRADSEAHGPSSTLVNGSVTGVKQVPFVDSAPVPKSSATSPPSTTSNPSAECSERPTEEATMIQDSERKDLSQKPSVSTICARNGRNDQKDFRLIGLYRVVSQGVVGSISTLLCGRRRKLFAVVLTALIVPVLAWTWQS